MSWLTGKVKQTREASNLAKVLSWSFIIDILKLVSNASSVIFKVISGKVFSSSAFNTTSPFFDSQLHLFLFFLARKKSLVDVLSLTLSLSLSRTHASTHTHPLSLSILSILFGH